MTTYQLRAIGLGLNGGTFDCNEGEFFVMVQNDQVQSARIHLQGVPQE